MKHLFSLFLLVAIAAPAFAQPDTDADSSGEQRVKEQVALLNDFMAYISEIDAAINTSKFAQHRLNLNANSDKILGVGAFNRTVTVYYQVIGKESFVKKIIVLHITDKAQEYIEMVFDPTEKLARVTHSPNMGGGNADQNKTYYYKDEQMVLYTKGGTVYGLEKYDQNAFQESVDWLNKAEEYRNIFESIARTLPMPK